MATLEYSTHREGDPLYVGPTLRRCPGCKPKGDLTGVHELSMFKRHPREPDKYTAMCRDCIKTEIKLDDKNTHIEAVKTLTTVLAKATRGNATKGKSYAEVLSIAHDAMGGAEATYDLVGQFLKRSLDDGLEDNATEGTKDRAVKVSTTLLNAAALVEKTKGPPVDLSELTEEELRDILLEPARQLILSDATFRRQLLNDEDVRQVLMLDAGVELLEVN